MDDSRTMQSYQIFSILPDPSTGVRVPFLFLELSRQPVLLTISPLSIAQMSKPDESQQDEEMKQQVALSRAVQEGGVGENLRPGNSKDNRNNSDVGGSMTQNPLAEDVELEVYTTCSIYCIKYALWRRLHVPIQNISL